MFRDVNIFADSDPAWKSVGMVIGIATAVFLASFFVPEFGALHELRDSAPVHTILEMFSIAVSGSIFAVAWNGRLYETGAPLALLACGFLGVALFDVAHVLSFRGMPAWVTPSGHGKAIHFWFAARILSVASLAGLIFVPARVLRRRGLDWVMLGSVLAMVALFSWIVLWHPDVLPVYIVPGKGLTTIKITLEWMLVVCAALLIVAVWRTRDRTFPFSVPGMCAALAFMVLSEACFTRYIQAQDFSNLLGHIYKVFSYAFLYGSLVTGTIRRPYRLLSYNREILQQLTDNIQQVFWIAEANESRRILYVSPAYEQVWQRTGLSLVEAPRSWLDPVHPADKDRIASSIARQVDEESETEFRIARPDGSERWIRSRTFPIRDADGGAMRIAGVAEDITELVHSKQLNARQFEMVSSTLRENHALTRQLIQNVEDERRRIVRELHDELGQSLTAVRMEAGVIEAEARDTNPEILERARAICEISGGIYDAAREIMKRLRPGVLDELGLADAVLDLVEDWRGKCPDMEYDVDVVGDFNGLCSAVTITIYRVMQECLTNIMRHAAATRVSVRLIRTDTAGEPVAAGCWIRLQIADNGVGIQEQQESVERPTYGLRGIRERVEGLSGTLQLKNRESGGLEVIVLVPCDERTAEAASRNANG